MVDEQAPGTYEAAFGLLAVSEDSATLHLLGDAPRLPHVPPDAVRLLASSELAAMDWLPLDLLSEFRVAYSPIAASLVEGYPVSFCYAAARTEGLWDISINTLKDSGTGATPPGA